MLEPNPNSRYRRRRCRSSLLFPGRHRAVRRAFPASALLFLIFSFVSFLPSLLFGQQTGETDKDRRFPSLYRIPQGWFGIDREKETDRLLLYDRGFRELAQTQWLDLHPLDFAPLPAPWGDTAALLLARPSGATVLFRVRLTGAPELVPIWQTSERHYNTIVTVRNPVLQKNPEAVLAGDSGLTAIDMEGTQVYARNAGLLAPPLYNGTGGAELTVLERLGSSLAVSWLDAGTGNVLATRPLDAGGRALWTVIRTGPTESELVVAASDPPALYRFRRESRGFQERISIPEFPDALLPLAPGNGVALLYREYPAPRVLILNNSALTERRLYYPDRDIYADPFADGRFTILPGENSAAVYDGNLNYLCSVPAAGGPHPRLLQSEPENGEYILATDAGSRIVTIREERFLWLRRTWPYILGGAIALLALWSGLSAYRRFRFIRAVYANLVQAPDSAGVVVTSGRGRVLQLNQRARMFLNIDTPVPLGRHVSSYLQPEELRPVLDSTRRLLATGEPFEIELPRTLNGNQRTLRFQGRIMFGRYGTASGYMLLAEDITASLERDRLVNWASVAHHIAHEMKTPLGTVRTTAELMRQTVARHPEPEKLAPSIQRILRQSIRLREIVDDLLTVARTESLNRMDTDLALLFSSLIDEFGEYVPPTIQLRYETRGADFRGYVDPDQLTIAIRNLLVNARQAIGERESGKITLTLHGEPERLRIVVEDNGIGMSRATLDRLFQPYYTEKEGGSGIGTIIVKRVIEGHGGAVEVESEPGAGTTFTVKLPRGE